VRQFADIFLKFLNNFASVLDPRLGVATLQRERTQAGTKPMKIVMAIIKPFKLDEVRDAGGNHLTGHRCA
jgi:hypothetical protein